jgi:hypothetical protein
MKPGKPLKRKTPLRSKKPERVPKGCTTLERLLGEGRVQRASSFTAKKKPMKKKSATNKGWWDVALEIWAERIHACEVCGVPLPDEPQPINFSHLLPRGSYRRYKRDPRNIELWCADCHTIWHNTPHKALYGLPGWGVVIDRYYKLRNEAHGL